MTSTDTPAPPAAEAEKPTIVKGPQLFPAGVYAAADPMLVLPGDAWHHIVFTLMSGHASVTVNYRGSLILVWTTKNGEGVYPLYEGGRFRANVITDNCLLCLAPVELLELSCSPDEAKNTMAYAGIGIYEVGATAPRITADGNVAHGNFEVITCAITTQEIGEDFGFVNDTRSGL
jgi:hypothetical protein